MSTLTTCGYFDTATHAHLIPGHTHEDVGRKLSKVHHALFVDVELKILLQQHASTSYRHTQSSSNCLLIQSLRLASHSETSTACCQMHSFRCSPRNSEKRTRDYKNLKTSSSPCLKPIVGVSLQVLHMMHEVSYAMVDEVTQRTVCTDLPRSQRRVPRFLP